MITITAGELVLIGAAVAILILILLGAMTFVEERTRRHNRARRSMTTPDRERNIAEIVEEGRNGMCEACGRAGKVQKCHVKDEVMRLCNDCLYSGNTTRREVVPNYAEIFDAWGN